MAIFCRADIYCDQSVGLCANIRFATVQQVRTRSANGVLDDVSDERCKYNRDEKREVCDFMLGS
jgi:hypothetical protein